MKKQKVLKVLGAAALVGLTTLTMTSCSLTNWIDGIIHPTEKPETPDDDNKQDSGNVIVDGKEVGEDETVDLPQSIVFRRNAAGQTTSINVRATVLPDTVVNKKLKWSLVWSNNGQNGDISNYVTVTPSSDTLSATITLKAGFNYQIKLIVSSQQTPDKSVSCTLDYQNRLTSIVSDRILCGCFDNNMDTYKFSEDVGGYNMETIFGSFDDIWESEEDCHKYIRLLDFSDNVFNTTGTIGTAEIGKYLSIEFDDKYISDTNTYIHPNNQEWADRWGENKWLSFDELGIGNQTYLSLYDFENITTNTNSVKGLYGGVSGSFLIKVKFIGADGFEKIYSCGFGSADIPSLTDVTGIILDNTTYVF